MTGMDTGEVDPRTQAALDLAGTYVFGTEPGRIPAVLFAAYDASAADLDRALLGAELARCWVYSRERNRAVPFAVAAVKHAEATGDPAVLADALDAALATHWGPDELEVRVDLARKLADVTAHLGDAESRLKAHLWLLTVAAETLDVSELNRQVRALERLGEESRKALFFAATRRLMLDLMRGRADTIAPLLALARETADALPDGDMVVLALTGYGAVQAGDRSDEVVAAARGGEALAEQEGIREVFAELAWIYLGLGLPDDARRLASTFDQRVLSGLPRDHNYLLDPAAAARRRPGDRARRDGRDHHAAAAPVRRPGRDQRRCRHVPRGHGRHAGPRVRAARRRRACGGAAGEGAGDVPPDRRDLVARAPRGECADQPASPSRRPR